MSRFLTRNFELLEPYAGKLARTVLRGERISNGPDLPDTTKRSKGLSSRNYNFRDTSTIQDSLRTHPDCSARYARSLSQNTPNPHFSPIPAQITEKTNKMLIWNMYTNFNLTPCLYRILMEKDKNNPDPWYDFMTTNVLVSLYFSDKQLNRFNAIGITPKEYISKSYYELQTMLEQIPREDLEKYCKSYQNAGFWNKMPPAEKALKSLLYSVALDADDSQKTRSKAAKEFTASHGESMYCELAEDLSKK